MIQPLDLRQTEPNSCLSLVVINVLHTLGRRPLSQRQVDTELDRRPGQLPKKSPIPIWLRHKLDITHFSTFDVEQFITRGIDYLREHNGSRWNSAKLLRNYWTPQRIVEYQQYLQAYQKQIQASGDHYWLIPREPDLADINRALKQHDTVCQVNLGMKASHATMVYGRDDEGNYLIYYPEKSYSLDTVPAQYIDTLWRSRRSLTVVKAR